MLLNTLDTTVSIQRGKKLCYALPMRIVYEETQNLKRYSVKDCPYQANKDIYLNFDFDEVVRQVWTGHQIPGHPELPVEKAAEIKILSKKDPVPLDLLLRSNLYQQELSHLNINSLSLLVETVQVTPQVMRMLGGLLEREVTRDDPEWAAAMASLTVSEKVKIMPSRRQHKENERHCRTIVQQLVSSIPQNLLTSTSYKRKEQVRGTQKKTVTFEDHDQLGEEVERNLDQDYLSGETNGEESRRFQDQNQGLESLSGESDVAGKLSDEEQDLEDKILSGEF